MKRAALGVLALTLTACQSSPDAAALLAPPPTGEITAPARNVPAAIAAFSGTWRGQWQTGQQATLAVQTVARDGAATGTYSWGDLPDRQKAGSAAFTGRISGGSLTLDTLPNGAAASFAMQGGSALAGAYILGGEPSTGTFNKAIPPEQPAVATPDNEEPA